MVPRVQWYQVFLSQISPSIAALVCILFLVEKASLEILAKVGRWKEVLIFHPIYPSCFATLLLPHTPAHSKMNILGFWVRNAANGPNRRY